MKTIITITMFLSLFACREPPLLCDGYCDGAYNTDGYEVNAVWRDDLRIDAPASYDTKELSALVGAVDDCLRDIGELPREEAVDALCWHQQWSYADHPLRRECFEIKVVNSWQWSHDFEYQMLYDEAPFEFCAAKGFEKGPCYWRVVVQNGYQVCTTPNADLVGEPIVSIATRCLSPYNSPKLARCASISDHWMTASTAIRD